MKKFFKRLIILPLMIVAVWITIIMWNIDLLNWFFTGNYVSELREKWEDSDIAYKIFQNPFDWTYK